MEQRSQEWHEFRVGKITASRFADVMSKGKGGKSSERRNTYLRDIVAEILTGKAKEPISSASLSWGTEVEPFAREAYELETGNVVNETGFLLHLDHLFVGCSPDGLIGVDGGLEMKCPKDPQVHVKTLLEGMPSEHIAQVQGGMYVTGREWWDFVSYDPRQPEPTRLYIQRVHRDEEFIQSLDIALLSFWDDVQKAIKQITERAA